MDVIAALMTGAAAVTGVAAVRRMRSGEPAKTPAGEWVTNVGTNATGTTTSAARKVATLGGDLGYRALDTTGTLLTTAAAVITDATVGRLVGGGQPEPVAAEESVPTIKKPTPKKRTSTATGQKKTTRSTPEAVAS